MFSSRKRTRDRAGARAPYSVRALGLPLKSGLSPEVTLIRASTHTVTDYLGAVHNVKSGEARFYGARRTENLCLHSEDFVTGWTVGSGVRPPVSVAGVSLRTGRQSIKRVERDSGGSNMMTRNSTAYKPGQHTFSVGLATGNGTETVRLRIEDQVTSTLLAQVDVVPPAYNGPASMRTYAVFGTIPDTQNYRFIITNPNPGGSTVYVDGALIQYTHGRAGGVPDDYVPVGVDAAPWYGANVDGVKYWDTECGNTISSGLVTFAAGAAIAENTLKGLMVERGTVNGLFSSRDLNAAEWTKYQVSGGALADCVPLGANSLRKMAEDNSLNSHRIGQVYRSTTPNDNTRMTVSCYAKKAERDVVRIGFINKAGTVNLAYFNLTTGVVSNISGGAEVEAYMYAVGDCYRLVLTGSAGSGATAIEALYGMAITAGTANYQGVSGSGAFFGGFQFEPIFVATAYHGDTGSASTLTTVGDNAYTSASYFPSDKWEVSCDFTPFFNSNSNNKPNWIYMWYARTDVNNRHGLAIRPGTFGGFNDSGSDDFVYDLYNGDDETSWDGVDFTLNTENMVPLDTKKFTIQMHDTAATGTSNLRGFIGETPMNLTVSGVHSMNTTPVTTYLRFGINDATIGQVTGLYHSFCIKNFFIEKRPVKNFEEDDVMLVINKAQLATTSASAMGAGAKIRIADMRNIELVSNGSTWRPAGGRQTLYINKGSLASPLATMTGNGAAQTFTLPETLLIPANLIKEDMNVYAEVVIKRGGTAQGFTQVVCLGTANTCVSDQSFIGQTIANTDGNETRLFGAAQFFNSTTSFLSMGSLVPNSTTTANQVLKNLQINTAADMYVSIGCSTTNFINPDTSNLISYHIWIEG